MAEQIHTCSAHCHRPECVKVQRDRLRDWVFATHGNDGLVAALLHGTVAPKCPDGGDCGIGGFCDACPVSPLTHDLDPEGEA